MFDEIDMKKLIEQTPEFKDYINDVLFGLIMGDKNGEAMAASIYNFYNIGMAPEQVIKWMRGMNNFMPPKTGPGEE